MSSAKVNNQNMFGQTPLIVAIRAGKTEKSASLLKVQELDVNIKDNEGRTALMHASILGNLNIVKLILQREEVDVNLKDNYGYLALTHALEGAAQGLQQIELNFFPAVNPDIYLNIFRLILEREREALNGAEQN